MKQIHTREQLEKEIMDIIMDEVTYIIYDEYDSSMKYGDVVRKICDLIADLPNMCFHETNVLDQK